MTTKKSYRRYSPEFKREAIKRACEEGMTSDEMAMDSRISIITLGVNDLGESVRFYRDGLGLNLRDDSNAFIAFFQLNGMLLALFPSGQLADDAGVEHEKAKFSGITLAQNVGSPEDVDKILQLATAAGATITKQGEDKSWGGYSGYFQDPDGYLWEVAWNPNLIIDQAN